MPNPHNSLPEPIERLHVMTLALQSAAVDEDWGQFDALMNERGRLINETHVTEFRHESFQLVLEAEGRLMTILKGKREHLLSDLEQSLRGRQLHASLLPKDRFSSIDQAG